jgi:YVTN family beta-propeller protein
MVVVSSGLDRMFTSNVSSGTISIIEQVNMPMPPGLPPGAPAGAGPPPGMPAGPHKTWKVTNVASGPGSEGFDLSPDGATIWAANAQDGTVTVIDVAGKKAVATFPVGVRGNRLKFTLDGKRALISGAPAGEFGAAGANFAVIDVATRKVIKELNMGGGSGGILVAPDGARAFVAVGAAGKSKVCVVDLKTLALSGEVAVGNGADGLAWAGK